MLDWLLQLVTNPPGWIKVPAQKFWAWLRSSFRRRQIDKALQDALDCLPQNLGASGREQLAGRLLLESLASGQPLRGQFLKQLEQSPKTAREMLEAELHRMACGQVPNLDVRRATSQLLLLISERLRDHESDSAVVNGVLDHLRTIARTEAEHLPAIVPRGYNYNDPTLIRCAFYLFRDKLQLDHSQCPLNHDFPMDISADISGAAAPPLTHSYERVAKRGCCEVRCWSRSVRDGGFIWFLSCSAGRDFNEPYQGWNQAKLILGDKPLRCFGSINIYTVNVIGEEPGMCFSHAYEQLRKIHSDLREVPARSSWAYGERGYLRRVSDGTYLFLVSTQSREFDDAGFQVATLPNVEFLMQKLRYYSGLKEVQDRLQNSSTKDKMQASLRAIYRSFLNIVRDAQTEFQGEREGEGKGQGELWEHLQATVDLSILFPFVSWPSNTATHGPT